MPRPNKIHAAAFFVGTQIAANDKNLGGHQTFNHFQQKGSLLSAEMPGQQMISKRSHPPRSTLKWKADCFKNYYGGESLQFNGFNGMGTGINPANSASMYGNTPTINSDNASDQSVLSSESSDQDSIIGVGARKSRQRKVKKSKKRELQVSTFITSAEVHTNKCILRNQDPRRMKWDIFVICLALWNVFFIPYNVAFRPDIGQTPWFQGFNYFIDFAFFMDILVNFRTTYFNKDGDEIFSPKDIAKRYVLGGRFFIDLLASVPLDGINSELQIFGLLKLIRLSRLSRIITRLNFRDDVKIIFKVLELIFTLIVLIHCLACFWFYVVDIEDQWVPPLDFINLKTNLYNQTTFKQYFSSVYHAIMMLNGGEVGPRTVLELIFVSIIMLAGAIINANIFGNMAVLIQNMNRKDTKFQEQIDTANTAMKNLKLPAKTQRMVKDFMLSTQSTFDQQQELNKFLEMISPSLRFMVSSHIYSKMIVCNEVFTSLLQSDQNEKKQVINYVVGKLDAKFTQPQDLIIDYGSQGDKMYFIAKGQCSVEERIHKTRRFEHIRTLKTNDHFGEISLIYNCRRTMKVISKKYSILAVMTGQKFNKELIVEYPQILSAFNQKIFNYQDRSKVFLHTMVSHLPYFQGLDEHVLHDLIFSFKVQMYQKETLVFKEGELPKGLYLIQHGAIMLQIHTEGYDFPLFRLKKGSFLNYQSCIKTQLHQVSAYCENPVTLQFLSKQKMAELQRRHNVINDRISQVSKQIENIMNKPYSLDYYIPDVVKYPHDGTANKQRFKKQIMMRQIGGRNAKFRVKNMVIKIILEKRSRMKVFRLRNLIERQIQKERLESKLVSASPQERHVIQDQIKALMYSNTREGLQINYAKGIEDQMVSRQVTYDPNHIPVQLLTEHRKLADNVDRILKVLAIHSTALSNMESKIKTLTQTAQQRRPPRAGAGSSGQQISSRLPSNRNNKPQNNSNKEKQDFECFNLNGIVDEEDINKGH